MSKVKNDHVRRKVESMAPAIAYLEQAGQRKLANDVRSLARSLSASSGTNSVLFNDNKALHEALREIADATQRRQLPITHQINEIAERGLRRVRQSQTAKDSQE